MGHLASILICVAPYVLATMSICSFYSLSTKKKLNTNSSTETELMAVNDMLPRILWTRYFLEVQGYQVEDSSVCQDNISAMLLEKKNRYPSCKRTREINFHTFFITNEITSKKINVEHEPIEMMIGDLFTKPLRGSTFLRFRNLILNIDA